MESIQTNVPVLARAFDFAQEAKRKRDLEQQAAAKTEHTLDEQHANRVTFSQEAQTRLNEEKTHVANQVNEVRDAIKLAAAEARGKAMSEERQRAVEARAEARQFREERDSVARLKTEVANKAVADNREAGEKTASAAQKISADAVVKAIEQRSIKAEEIVKRTKVEDSLRTINAQKRETSDLLEKQKARVVVDNLDESKKNTHVAIEHSRKEKVINDHVKAETAKAMRMYQHIDTMGRSTRS